MQTMSTEQREEIKEGLLYHLKNFLSGDYLDHLDIFEHLVDDFNLNPEDFEDEEDMYDAEFDILMGWFDEVTAELKVKLDG